MDQSTERRKSSRLPISFLIICYVKTGEQHYHGNLLNMSTTGLYMELEGPVQADCKCEIDIVLNGVNSRLKIEGLQGKIIRSDSEGAAIRFDARLEWFALISTYFCHGI